MDTVNKFRPFKATADDFSQSNPIFAYYFYKYYLESAFNIYNDLTDQGQKAELEVEMKEVQGKMGQMKSMTNSMVSDEKSMRQILEYTQLMFAKNDHYYEDGQRNKQIAQDFLTIYRLYEVVNKFSKLEQKQNKRRIYSKKKFIDIMKEIKNKPQMKEPQPKPVIQEEVKKIDQKIMKSGFKPNLPKPSNLISFDKVQMQIESNKCLENAVSELSFDRFKIAREQTMKALELLDQIIDS